MRQWLSVGGRSVNQLKDEDMKLSRFTDLNISDVYQTH